MAKALNLDEFAAADFDVKDWINRALDENRPEDLLVEQYASTLVLQLQLAFSEVVQALDEAGKQAVNNIPRVLRDIDTVRYDASTLRERLDVVREDIEKVESETGKSIATISHVDKIKARMETTSESLRHAQRWDILLIELDRAWADHNVQQLADKIKEMRRALRSFSCLPDIDARRKQLDDAEKRLEDLNRPQLLEAFMQHDLDAASRLIEVQEELGRGQAARECYYDCHQSAASAMWTSLVESHPSPSGRGCDLRVVLTKMFDYVVSLLSKEAPWTVTVFGGQARDIQCNTVVHILNALSPSVADCMAETAGGAAGDATHAPAESLSQLLELHREAANFARAADSALRGDVPSSADAVADLVQAIYAPFVPYQRGFGDLVRRALLSQLSNDVTLTSGGFQDSARSIAESPPALFALLDAARGHCAAFTYGLAFPDFTSAVDAVMAEYTGKVEARVMHMRGLCDLDRVPRKAAADAAYHQDWSHFQGALVLLQACGDLILRVEKLAATIGRTLVDEADKVVGLRNDALTAPYNYLFATPRHCAALRGEVKRVQDGDAEMLAQSKQCVQRLNNTVHQMAFDILFNQIDRLLRDVPTLSAWSSLGGVGGMLGMPSFSLTQQNYVTQVGQHMLTLPQQLEPMVSGEEDADNPSLRTALGAGTLPYRRSHKDTEEDDETGHAPEWLEAVAVGTMQTYIKRILEIPKLSQHGANQLVKDMEYLNNVLNVLDVDPTDEWSYALRLLSAPAAEMKTLVTDTPLADLRKMGEKLLAIRS